MQNKLTPEQQLVVEARVNNKKKSVVVAYILWFFLGGFAIHCFYLESPGMGALRLFLGACGYFLLISGSFGLGVCILVILAIWWCIELFTIPSIVEGLTENARKEYTQELLKEEQKLS